MPRLKSTNKKWTKEQLEALVRHYEEFGMKPNWVQIYSCFPNDFGGFDPNDIGSKARKIGLNKVKSTFN
jgi:hypothetical protein